jgi:hypothetical protein
MYLNPHNEALVQQIDMMDRKKVRNMEAIDEGYGYSGGRMKQITMKDLGIVPFIKPMTERAIGGKKRGRPSKKMQGEGFWSDFADGFTSVFDVAGKVLPVVAPFVGLGKQKGQRKYKKQAEEMYACGGSGFASGSHMDTGFDRTSGAGFSGGQKEEILKMFFSKGKAKKMKEKLEGEGFWSDFADGFVKGFTGTMDVAGKVLPVVAPFIGLGKKGRKTTRTDLEQMGKYVPDKAVEQSQMLGSDMSGMGRKKVKCMCEGQGFSGGADTRDEAMAKIVMKKKLAEKNMEEPGLGKLVASFLSPKTPPSRTRSLVAPPAPKRRKTGDGSSGGRRTEEMGDFSGGFSGMGSSGGKKSPNAWIQLVSKVRKEQGLKSVKDAIAYIKDKKLYTKK